MKQCPVAVGVVLCERVIVDAKTGGVTPVNCFNVWEVEAFPGLLDVYALAYLTDGIGKMAVRVVVEQLDNSRDIFEVQKTLEFANPLNELRCVVHLSKCLFPVPGNYNLAFYVDKEPVAQRKFKLKKRGG